MVVLVNSADIKQTTSVIRLGKIFKKEEHVFDFVRCAEIELVVSFIM